MIDMNRALSLRVLIEGLIQLFLLFEHFEFFDEVLVQAWFRDQLCILIVDVHLQLGFLFDHAMIYAIFLIFFSFNLSYILLWEYYLYARLTAF